MSGAIQNAASKSLLSWDWADDQTVTEVKAEGPLSYSVAWTPSGDGTGAKDVTKLYAKPLTVTAGTPTTLNLTDGSLLDWTGGALVFTKLKDIFVWLVSGPTLLKVTPGGNTLKDSLHGQHANAVDIVIPAGGVEHKVAPTAAGFAVGADGTLVLSCSTTNAVVRVALLGR